MPSLSDLGWLRRYRAPRRGYSLGVREAGGAVPPEGRVTHEADGRPPPDAEEARRAAQLEGIERDMDTVDAALAALDADDVEGAEALAAELDEPAGDPAADNG